MLIIQVNSENMGIRSIFYKSQWNLHWRLEKEIIHWHCNSPFGETNFLLNCSVSTVCCSPRSIMGLCNPKTYFTSKLRSLQPHNSNIYLHALIFGSKKQFFLQYIRPNTTLNPFFFSSAFRKKAKMNLNGLEISNE